MSLLCATFIAYKIQIEGKPLIQYSVQCSVCKFLWAVINNWWYSCLVWIEAMCNLMVWFALCVISAMWFHRKGQIDESQILCEIIVEWLICTHWIWPIANRSILFERNICSTHIWIFDYFAVIHLIRISNKLCVSDLIVFLLNTFLSIMHSANCTTIEKQHCMYLIA